MKESIHEHEQSQLPRSPYAEALLRMRGGEEALRENINTIKNDNARVLAYQHKKIQRLVAVKAILNLDKTGYFHLDSFDFEQVLDDLDLTSEEREFWLEEKEKEIAQKNNPSTLSRTVSAVGSVFFETPKARFISRIERELEFLNCDREDADYLITKLMLDEDLSDHVVHKSNPESKTWAVKYWDVLGKFTIATAIAAMAIGVFIEGLGFGVLITPLLEAVGVHIVLAGTVSLLLANAAACACVGLIIGCVISFTAQAFFGRPEMLKTIEVDGSPLLTAEQRSDALLFKFQEVPSAIQSINQHATKESKTEKEYQRIRRSHSMSALPGERFDSSVLPRLVVGQA